MRWISTRSSRPETCTSLVYSFAVGMNSLRPESTKDRSVPPLGLDYNPPTIYRHSGHHLPRAEHYPSARTDRSKLTVMIDLEMHIRYRLLSILLQRYFRLNKCFFAVITSTATDDRCVPRYDRHRRDVCLLRRILLRIRDQRYRC